MDIIGPTTAVSNIPPRVAFTLQVRRPCKYVPTRMLEHTNKFHTTGILAIVLQITGELLIYTDFNTHNNITI